jgi:hypothetical protein
VKNAKKGVEVISRSKYFDKQDKPEKRQHGGKREGAGKKNIRGHSVTVGFRTTPEIRQKIIDEAKKSNMTIGDYILTHIPLPEDDETDK